MTIRDITVALGFEVDKSSEKAAENSIKGIKSMAKKLLGGIAVAFSVTKLAAFGKDCVQAASDVEQMQNKFDVVFGDLSKQVDDWANQFADSVGRNKNTIKSYLADQQNLLVGFGMTREEGAKMSEQMTSLAMDIASFANLDEATAVDAMSKALMGESESAKTLGAVLNDSTREAAMLQMGLTGSYESLDQLSKIQVNYTAIAMQSKDAIGDCVRSMDSYESRQRQLTSAVQEFKEFVGGQLMPVMAVFVGWVTNAVKAATKFAQAILLDADGNNRLLLAFDRVHATVKRLQPAMERFSSSISTGIKRATDVVKVIVDKLGGMENTIKLVTIVAGSLFLALNWSSVIGIISSIKNAITGIGKAIGSVKLKTVGIAAAITILALLVDDFINFLIGNDSVIGTVFDDLGIGADNARQAVFNTFDKIKNFLTRTWTEIKSAFSKHGESLKNSIKNIFGGLVTIASEVFKPIVAVASAVFFSLGNILDNVDFSTPINAAVSVLDILTRSLGKLGQFISNHANLVGVLVKAYGAFKIGSVISQLAKLTAGFVLSTAAKTKDIAETIILKGMYAKDFAVSLASTTAQLVKQAAQFAITTAAKVADTVAQGAMTAATVAWNVAATVATAATTALGAAVSFLTSPIGIVIVAITALIAVGVLLYKNWDKVKEFALKIWSVISKVVGNAWENIKNIVSTASNAVKTVITSALETIKALWNTVWGAISGFFKGIWNGIVSFFSGIWSGITGLFSSALNGIIALWQSIWNAVSSFFKGIWNGIVSFISGAWNKITGSITGALQKAKSTIGNVLTTVKSTFSNVWNTIISIVSSVFGRIRDTVSNGINSAKTVVSNRLSAIKTAFVTIWNAISKTVTSVFTKIKNTVSNFISAIKNTVSNRLKAIKTVFSTVFNAVKGVVSSVLSKVKSVVSSVIGAVKSTISSRLTAIKTTFTNIWNSIKSFISNTLNNMLSKVKSIFSNILSSISGAVGKIKGAVVKGFTAAIDWIKGLPSKALTWGTDIITGIVKGIKGAIGKVKDAVKGVADTIKSYLHFSVPDVGPLTDYESWMPDFMKGLASGIKGSKGEVVNQVKGLASDMTILMQSATANPATAAGGIVNNSSSTRNVTQNVNISNSYSGATREVQKNISKGMNKSAVDATTQMARALAYARG